MLLIIASYRPLSPFKMCWRFFSLSFFYVYFLLSKSPSSSVLYDISERRNKALKTLVVVRKSEIRTLCFNQPRSDTTGRWHSTDTAGKTELTRISTSQKNYFLRVGNVVICPVCEFLCFCYPLELGLFHTPLMEQISSTEVRVQALVVIDNAVSFTANTIKLIQLVNYYRLKGRRPTYGLYGNEHYGWSLKALYQDAAPLLIKT